ncbi:Uncharacterized conserved protein, tellurite resistance protein B (TerB) family [Solimonas aquatica]|uniref:Uncharacterized conserved protein, tellurite resistance protein B (TerB) family n=1 Tax=Solimonas aquatica TaxID=489703 RepID=A0A1H9E1C5_9GAMM|nr:TerB family tellurite resistance protein [Solimonas aquatica]SEQ19465.1 Uncharacterized conserved protein, tellurite resistance protein B (TerB) family [Solimonas aquatica]
MSFLRRLTQAFAPPPRAGLDRHLAMAVLLLEIAAADFSRSEEELGLIRKQLLTGLQLDASSAEALLSRALDRSDAAISMHEFVALLNEELDAAGKRELLSWLWQVALADGRLAPHEEGRIRQLADLLFIPHADFVQTRLAAGA